MNTTTAKPDPAMPAAVADVGKIRLEAGFGLLPPVSPPAVADSGKIRLGAGFGLLPPTAR